MSVASSVSPQISSNQETETLEWKEVYRKALFEEIQCGSLYNGKVGNDKFWAIHENSIAILQTIGDGMRNKKLVVGFCDIIQLNLLEASGGFLVEPASPASTEFDMNLSLSYEVVNQPCAVMAYNLCIKFINRESNQVSIVFLPWVNGKLAFDELLKLYSKAASTSSYTSKNSETHSNPTSATKPESCIETANLSYDNERFKIKWQFDDEDKSWCITKERITVAFVKPDNCLSIPLYNIKQVHLSDGSNLNVTYYSIDSSKDALSESKILLRQFGNSSDLNELQLLMRQEFQLKLIIETFSVPPTANSSSPTTEDIDSIIFHKGCEFSEFKNELDASASPSLAGSNASLVDLGHSTKRNNSVVYSEAIFNKLYIDTTSIEKKHEALPPQSPENIFVDIEKEFENLLDQLDDNLKRLTIRRNSRKPKGTKKISDNKEDAVAEQGLYIALYSYDNSDEISFNKGDLLKVLTQDPNGWWYALLLGAKNSNEDAKEGEVIIVGEGWVPSNYLLSVNPEGPI